MADGLLFNRFCKAVIGYGDEEVFEVSGLRMKFEAQKMIYGYNVCKLSIYNLDIREKRIQAKVVKRKDGLDYGVCTLYAGYAESSGMIFSGQIKNVFSHRKGPDVITDLYIYGGQKALENGYVSHTFQKGASLQEQLAVGFAALRKADPSVARSKYFVDSAKKTHSVGSKSVMRGAKSYLDELGTEFGFNWSIQNGVFIATGLSDANGTFESAQVIAKDTGMIGAPALTERGVYVKNLLLWDMDPHKPFRVESKYGTVKLGVNLYTDQTYKTIGEGHFRAFSVVHRGDTRGNTWETVLEGSNFLT